MGDTNFQCGYRQSYVGYTTFFLQGHVSHICVTKQIQRRMIISSQNRHRIAHFRTVACESCFLKDGVLSFRGVQGND